MHVQTILPQALHWTYQCKEKRWMLTKMMMSGVESARGAFKVVEKMFILRYVVLEVLCSTCGES
jgi:hypothetical protein